MASFCSARSGSRSGEWRTPAECRRRHDAQSIARELTHAWPVFLPDGRRFLYLAVRATSRHRRLCIRERWDRTRPGASFAADIRAWRSPAPRCLTLSKGLLIAHEPMTPDRVQVGGAPRPSRTASPPTRHCVREPPSRRRERRRRIPECEPGQPPDLVRSERATSSVRFRRGPTIITRGCRRTRSVGRREDRPGDRQAHDLDARSVARHDVADVFGSARGAPPVLVAGRAAHGVQFEPSRRHRPLRDRADGGGGAQLLLSSKEGRARRHRLVARRSGFFMYQAIRAARTTSTC